jgi:hypothetical protein
VEELVATKQPKRYDEAVGLLIDLRDLAARKDGANFRPKPATAQTLVPVVRDRALPKS